MSVIDFTKLPKRNKMYAGANGSKIAVIYEGEQYMLKFPTLPTKNKDMSYSNSKDTHDCRANTVYQRIAKTFLYHHA